MNVSIPPVHGTAGSAARHPYDGNGLRRIDTRDLFAPSIFGCCLKSARLSSNRRSTRGFWLTLHIVSPSHRETPARAADSRRPESPGESLC